MFFRSLGSGILCLSLAWAAPTVSYSSNGFFGEISVPPGSFGLIANLGLDAGGSDDAAALFGSGGACVGKINAAQPDVTLTVEAALPVLGISVNSEADTTLVVVGPDGAIYCNDDSEGTDPSVQIPDAGAGNYQVWVGVFGDIAPAELSVVAGPPAGHAAPDTPGLYGDVVVPSGADGLVSRLTLDAGGSDRAERFDAGCVGTVNAAQPDLTMTLETAARRIRIEARSQADTSLIVVRPDGSVVCNDDADGLNPAVDLRKASAGRYQIWLGVYGDVTTAEVDIIAGAGSVAAGEAEPPLALVDRTLPLNATPGSLAEIRARAIVSGLEALRRSIAGSDTGAVTLTTSAPVQVREQDGAVDVVLPDLDLLADGTNFGFGTVSVALAPEAAGEVSWTARLSNRIAVSTSGIPAGEITWRSARVAGRYIPDLGVMTGYDIDVADVALHEAGAVPTATLGQLRVALDLETDNAGLSGGPGRIEMRDLVFNAAGEAVRIARMGIDSTLKNADLATFAALQADLAMAGGDASAHVPGLLASLLRTAGSSLTTFYIEGIDAQDETGAPARLERLALQVGIETSGAFTSLKLGVTLAGLEVFDPAVPPAFGQTALDIDLGLEGIPANALLAGMEGLDAADPASQDQLAALALAALATAPLSLRIERLDIETPDFSLSTRGRLSAVLNGVPAPEGEFDLTVRGIDALIAETSINPHSSTVAGDIVPALIFFKGLGKLDGGVGPDHLTYKVQLQPDLTVLVNGVDVTKMIN